MLKKRFLEIENVFSGTLEYDFPRAKYAYYRIGGEAEVIATPKTFADLQAIHKIIWELQAPYFILGWGSNLLFSDQRYAGVVIRMKHLFTEIEPKNEVAGKSGQFLKLGASLGASSLLKKAAEAGYGGFEHLTGIPGSVGGMVAMNAGTHLGEIGQRLQCTEFVNLNRDVLQTQIKIHGPEDFSYRKNHFLSAGDLVTHTYIRYQSAESAQVKNEIDALYLRRKATQPVDLPSCGSVFMNPRDQGLHAWEVMDQLGLRGHQIGQAQISEKHPNFIVNLGGAKASDVKALIDLAKARAQVDLKIELQEEVKFIP